MQSGAHEAAYVWRFGSKLKAVTSTFPDEASSTQFNYDGLGKRRNRLVGDTSLTWWRWDAGMNAIAEYAGTPGSWTFGAQTSTYIPGLAEIPGADASTGAYRYIYADHLGSVRSLRDQGKSTLAAYEYDPYGGVYAQSGLPITHGYTGHIWNPEIALYYAPYRYYSPTTSRWLTRDPLGMVDGPNVYGYPFNPVLTVDKTGLYGTYPTSDWWDKNRSKPDECCTRANLLKHAREWRNRCPGEDPYNNHMRHCSGIASAIQRFGFVCGYGSGWINEFEGQFSWSDVKANQWGWLCSMSTNYLQCCKRHAPKG